MEKDWKDLTAGEKKAARLAQWLSPAGARFSSPEVARTYKARVQRLIDAIDLKKPDRVPLMLPTANFPIHHAGRTVQQAMYDYEELRVAWMKFICEFETDVYRSPSIVWPGKAFEDLDYRLYKWPGHGLAGNAPSYQFIEGEYMKADEYDALIRDPSDFWMRVFLPRVFGAFEPFRRLSPFTTLVEVPVFYFLPYTQPEVQAALQTLIDTGREIAKWFEIVRDCDREALAAGLPCLQGMVVKAPFDVIGDTLRGTQGIIKDMYRQPDKLIEALEKIASINVEHVKSHGQRGQFISMYLHKGSDGFMSPKQFETFYWPTLKKVILGIIHEGFVPVLFAEGTYDSRLETVKDLPERSVIWWFDQTDMARAKRILGEKACLAGNVPSSLMCTGTPETVKEKCRELIEAVGKGGGFILTGGANIDKGNPANLKAMMEAAKEYGVYGNKTEIKK
jgi:hypothetical protein